MCNKWRRKLDGEWIKMLKLIELLWQRAWSSRVSLSPVFFKVPLLFSQCAWVNVLSMDLWIRSRRDKSSLRMRCVPFKRDRDFQTSGRWTVSGKSRSRVFQKQSGLNCQRAFLCCFPSLELHKELDWSLSIIKIQIRILRFSVISQLGQACEY